LFWFEVGGRGNGISFLDYLGWLVPLNVANLTGPAGPKALPRRVVSKQTGNSTVSDGPLEALKFAG
jgi:hypothetical protein